MVIELSRIISRFMKNSKHYEVVTCFKDGSYTISLFCYERGRAGTDPDEVHSGHAISFDEANQIHDAFIRDSVK